LGEQAAGSGPTQRNAHYGPTPLVQSGLIADRIDRLQGTVECLERSAHALPHAAALESIRAI
jgi:hypothetical protein